MFGEGTFVAPRTVQVALRDGANVRSCGACFCEPRKPRDHTRHARFAGAKPLTHIEALDLERLPGHLVVLGGGYVGLELRQALRRLGSRVTVISRDMRLAANEDADVSEAVLQIFRAEGIERMSRFNSGPPAKSALRNPAHAIY